MSTTELQFRTAAFGGFQKQDVLDYIERSSREHGEKLAALRQELAEAVRAKEALEQELSDVQARESALRGELETTAGDLAQTTTRLEEAQARAEQAETALTGALEELETLRPAAGAYESLKDRAAGIELEAHCRAQEIQSAAEERARKTHQQVAQWLDRLQAEYGRIRGQMDAAAGQMSGDLEEIARITQGLTAVLDRQGGALEGLTECCNSPAHPAPAPLPLEEK